MNDSSIRHLDASAIVRRCRNAAGLTQRELAERLGTTQPVVSRWERGHDEPRPSTLDRVASACSLELTVQIHAVDDAVDLAQLRGNLALTPDQRLAAVGNLSSLLATARPVTR